MTEKDKILATAIRTIDKEQLEILVSLNGLKNELDECLKEKKELENIGEKEVDEITSPEIDKMFSNLAKFGEGFSLTKKLIEQLNEIKTDLKNVIKYDYVIGDVSGFIDLVNRAGGFRTRNVMDVITANSKLSGVKCNLKEKNFEEINDSIKKAKAIHSFYININEDGYTGDSESIINDIKKALSEIDFTFFNRAENILTQMQNVLDKKMDDIVEKISNAKASELEKRAETINKRGEEIRNKALEYDEKYKRISKVILDYDKYLLEEDPKILRSIIEELTNLGVLKGRDAKKLLYEKQEKQEEKKETIKEVKEEKIEEKKEKVLELDYYKDKDTQNIICFLGKDGDIFFDDIDDYFDNSSRPIVIKKLYELFYNLPINKDYIVQTGGNPHEGTTEKVKELLSRPFDFDYRRYGTGRDQYRIHAITRHSDLLERLEYGNGNIIFFGAVGPNDTTEKSFTYSRLGKRAVRAISDDNTPASLRSNFDSIEHITRGYVPVSLLSYEDKDRFNHGEFKNKIKGSIDQTCESNYVLYDILDNVSKNNVKVFLDDYFEKQSLKMFDIINEYNDSMKRGSLD